MSISFRTNLHALRAIGAIDRAGASIENSFNRLSSGTRLNRASDDPAGLAVSSTLQSKTRVLNRGRLNISDGVSALEIADGALGQIGTLLGRMAELAEQGANGSMSASQRRTLQAEYAQLDSEIRRISGTTTFNGISLLKGDKSARTTSTTVTATSNSVVNVSGDGRYVTYRASNGSLMQKDLVAGTDTALVSGANPTDVSVSASGEQVLFASTANLNGLNSTGRTAYYLYTKGTGTLSKLLTSGVGDTLDATLSADGSTVALSSSHTYNTSGISTGAGGNGYIHTIDTASGNVNLATTVLTASYTISSIAISQNGGYVGFTSEAFFDASFVNLFAVTGGTATVTTVATAAGLGTNNLQVSNSGTGYFTNNDGTLDGTPSIFAVRLGASTLAQGSALVTKVVSLEASASTGVFTLTNDGSSISFISTTNTTGENLNHASQIFEYDLATGTITQKTSATGAAVGTLLGFSNDGNTGYAISGGNIVTYDVSRAGLGLAIDTGSGTGTNSLVSNTLSATFGYLRGLGAHSVATQASARGTLDAVRRNIDLLNDIRGVIGAGVSRLESAYRVVGTTADETAQARSRIRDIDVAEETSRLIKNQVLQQAGTAVLAQANQQPRLSLGLLGI